MADDNSTPKPTIDLRLLGRQGRVNDIGRDIKVLLIVAQNHDEMLKEMRAEFGEMLNAINIMNGRLEAIERRLDLVEG